MSAPRPERMLDVVGVGFGPSNLALAIAIEEHGRDGAPLQALFLERQPAFGWHRGMLLDDATMQVSFLKDLATMRNPTSSFSFVAYLHERDRLAEFTNHKTLYPLRIEFHDYLEWAAARVAHLVRYGSEVVDVRPLEDEEGFEVEIAGGLTFRARNVVLAAGLRPRMPEGIERGPRVWHNAEFLSRIEELPAAPAPRRLAVVGAGQSAAEVTEALHARFQDAEICAVFSRYGYTPADDSPFANRIFDPHAVDVYFCAPEATKRMLMDYHRNTNYSVVDRDLIEELYRRAYQERVAGRQRLRIMSATRVDGVHGDDDGATLELESLATGEHLRLRADALIFATGYAPVDPRDLLGSAAHLCASDADGRVRVERDHRIATTPGALGAIYLQGATEHTHGIGSTLLSNVAVRAGEILDSITCSYPRSAVAPDPRPPSPAAA